MKRINIPIGRDRKIHKYIDVCGVFCILKVHVKAILMRCIFWRVILRLQSSMPANDEE